LISKSEKASGNTHCTVKPISLMKYLCTLFGHEGGTILDFTSGSGSTGIGALQAGMKFIGVELSREYFDIAVDRITFEEKKSLKIEIPNRENIPAYTKHLKSEIHFLLRLIESEKTNRKPTDDLALKLRIKVQELEQYIKGSKAA
jgi:DNA modification methylase